MTAAAFTSIPLSGVIDGVAVLFAPVPSDTVAGSLAVTVVDPIRFGPSTTSQAQLALYQLQGSGAITGLHFQIIDVSGPEHDRTYVCAARLVTADGLTIDVRTHGTGSKAAKRGAAIELLAIVREGSR